MIFYFKKGNSLTLKFLNNYYKIFLDKKYFKQEIEAYNQALLNHNFVKYIHPIKRNFLGYSSLEGLNIDYKNNSLVSKQLVDIFSDCSDLYEANHFINYDLLEKKLSRDLKKFKKKLLSLKLPKTGAHGDLHDGNIIINTNNDLKFIDWRNYRANNSVLYDIFHRDVRTLCKNKNISWTDAILNYDINENNFIKNSYNLSCIKLFYSLITIDLELTLNKNQYFKLNKFNKLLDKINLD